MENLTIEAWRYEELDGTPRLRARVQLEEQYRQEYEDNAERHSREMVVECCAAMGITGIDIKTGGGISRTNPDQIQIQEHYNSREGIVSRYGEHRVGDFQDVLDILSDIEDVDPEGRNFDEEISELYDDLAWTIVQSFTACWDTEIECIGTDGWAEAVSFCNGRCFTRNGTMIQTFRESWRA